MTIARPRPATLIFLARATAGVVLIAALAAVSHLLCSLSWQVDGGIALLVASAWTACAEVVVGSL